MNKMEPINFRNIALSFTIACSIVLGNVLISMASGPSRDEKKPPNLLFIMTEIVKTYRQFKEAISSIDDGLNGWEDYTGVNGADLKLKVAQSR